MKQLLRGILAIGCAFVMSACDQQGRPVQEFWMEKLEKGISTESDVRMVMGQPGTVWEQEDGARVLEYPTGPEGSRTWMFDVAKDGTLKDYRQVLTEENFANVTPGMGMDAVQRMLGKPRSAVQFRLKKEEIWDWHYLDGTTPRLFNVHFDLVTGKVTQTSSSDLYPG